MTDDSDAQITYDVRLRLSDGHEVKSGTFMTRRRRKVGDRVNLPNGPDGQSEAGPGFVWQVASVDDANVLVLTFDRPNQSTP